LSPERHSQRPDGESESLSKAVARRRVLEARDALTAAGRRSMSAAVCARAALLPELAEAGTVMSFASFRSELDTAPLADWVLAAGKTLCLPRVLGGRLMAAFRIDHPALDLAPGAWGIPEPREGLPEVDPQEIDIVLVPGSAFDEEGDRCGYGGGFYDTYLPLTRPGTPWVALAFELQLVPAIACEPHDLQVTAIVTEKRVIRPG
jgi:5-formyltetrahydrofolate cyclo-ligase